jgi:hypothetical protein
MEHLVGDRVVPADPAPSGPDLVVAKGRHQPARLLEREHAGDVDVHL